MDDEKEVEVVPETTEEVTPEVTPEESGEEVDWEAKAKKAEELANNYKIRAEKAEKKSKETVVAEPLKDGLSNKDVIFLAKSDIHEDDMDEVLDWAKFKKVPVSEAYKQLKTTLQVRAEERKSAEVSNTGNARRGSSQATGEALISQARSGKIPEKDADIQALIRAKMGIK